MIQIKKHIPNSLTCLNLFCGCMAVLAMFENENMEFASYWVFGSIIFDYSDGFAARMLKIESDLGKQLDSLADMVTFGFVPGLMLYFLIYEACLSTEIPENFIKLISSIGFLVTIFSAIRLARFNLDKRQLHNFIGLPTPANTIVIVSFPLILAYETCCSPIVLNLFFLIGITILQSWLLIAEIPLFSLKFKTLKWSENKHRFLFILSSVLLILFFRFYGIPIIILYYVLYSVLLKKFSPQSFEIK